jgi:hypothetical protein
VAEEKCVESTRDDHLAVGNGRLVLGEEVHHDGCDLVELLLGEMLTVDAQDVLEQEQEACLGESALGFRDVLAHAH